MGTLQRRNRRAPSSETLFGQASSPGLCGPLPIHPTKVIAVRRQSQQ